MNIEDQLSMRFVCPKCSFSGAIVKRFASTGTGLTKILDIQHNKFITLSCKNCGYTEMYNPDILEGKSHLGDILDVIFGS